MCAKLSSYIYSLSQINRIFKLQILMLLRFHNYKRSNCVDRGRIHSAKKACAAAGAAVSAAVSAVRVQQHVQQLVQQEA